MEFTLDTYDLQDIVIALICNDAFTLKKKPEAVQRLIDIFGEVNSKMCNEENDYKVKFTVSN